MPHPVKAKQNIMHNKVNLYFDDTPYKKLFVTTVTEIGDDEELRKIYTSNLKKFTDDFIEFCRREGFEEYIKISNEDFGIFVNSLILGVSLLGGQDRASYRALLKGVISAYFKDEGII